MRRYHAERINIVILMHVRTCLQLPEHEKVLFGMLSLCTYVCMYVCMYVKRKT
jgi:hypothetical protein